MVRFLKKDFWKRSKKPVPEDSQAHKTTNVDAERDSDAESEYRLRKMSKLIRRMELIGQSYQMTTAQGVLGSQTKTGGPRINGLPHRLPRVQLPGTIVATQVSAVG